MKQGVDGFDKGHAIHSGSASTNFSQLCDCRECAGKYVLLKDEEDPRLTLFNRPLPCCGCGIGWCSFLLGFLCPLIWYYAAVLYLRKHYDKDPRERSGLAVAAAAALLCTIVALCTLAAIFLPKAFH